MTALGRLRNRWARHVVADPELASPLRGLPSLAGARRISLAARSYVRMIVTVPATGVMKVSCPSAHLTW